MGGIFDHVKVVLPGQVADPADIADLTPIVDRDDCGDLSATCERGFNSLSGSGYIDVQVVRSAIDQQRNGIEITHHFGRGCKRHRRDYDRLAGFQSDRFERQMQRRGAGINRYRMGVLNVTRKLPLELFCFRTARQPAGPQAIDHLTDFRLTDARLIKGN